MDAQTYHTLITAVFCGSLVFFALAAAAVLVWIVKPLWRRGSRTFFLVFLLLAVWSVRFDVGCYRAIVKDDAGAVLTAREEFFNSFVHALQTFSLDEEYTEYITDGKDMVREAFGPETRAAELYAVYAALLNFLAPIAGGAFIVDRLSEFFPRMRLFFAKLDPFPEKYYFSELNEKSAALARSIAHERYKGFRAFFPGYRLIFTDVYTDEGEENSSELMTEAKALRAVCLKSDMKHVGFGLYSMKPNRIMLIDGSETANLETLSALMQREEDKKFLRGLRTAAFNRSEIYVFTADSVHSRLEEETAFIMTQKYDEVRRQAKERQTAGAEAWVREHVPTVIPVNGVRNMVYNRFIETPLFEPVAGNGKDTVTLTILGSGAIGTEFFLAATWCGQMPGRKLHVNVVSKEPASSFLGRVDALNPDILESAREGSPLLEYDRAGNVNDPYFTLSYREADVFGEDESVLRELAGSDYFIIALGSDEEDFAAADKIRRIVGADHMYRRPENRTVIAYVIYDPDLCRTLNRAPFHRYVPGSAEPDVFMRAFGDLDHVYGYANVFMEDTADAAYEMRMIYDGSDPRKKSEKRFRDIYTYRANIARRVHRRVKAFAALPQTPSVFADGDEEKHAGTLRALDAAFTKRVREGAAPGGSDKRKLLHGLACAEHRRWNAYIRSQGFRCPPGNDFGRYAKCADLSGHDEGSHKYVPLKMHPCLVECDPGRGIFDFDRYFDENGLYKGDAAGDSFLPEGEGDLLDDVSARFRSYDFKKYDYPCFDVTGGDLKNAGIG